MSPAANKTVAALRRRLEKWELEHLRELAADLDQRLERLQDELYRAQDSAEFWRENTMEPQRALHEDGIAVGITKEGQMVAFKNEAATDQVAPS